MPKYEATRKLRLLQMKPDKEKLKSIELKAELRNGELFLQTENGVCFKMDLSVPVRVMETIQLPARKGPFQYTLSDKGKAFVSKKGDLIVEVEDDVVLDKNARYDILLPKGSIRLLDTISGVLKKR